MNATAPSEEEIMESIPEPLEAPVFHIDKWDEENEPQGLTRLKSGESFLHGVKRIASHAPGYRPEHCPVSKGCKSLLPGMRVSQDQVGIILKNGSVRLRPPGAYRSVALNPWKKIGAVVPINREAGLEFDPLKEAANRNRFLRKFLSDLGQSYRQVVLQPQQVAVFENQCSTFMVTNGTYVYEPETCLRGVVDLNNMDPIIVERETEDTAASNATPDVRYNQHGRSVPASQGHGTTVLSTKRFIPSGYTKTIAGICFARPEKGFVVLHKSSSNQISMTEGICVAAGKEDFVRRARNESSTLSMNDLVVEFGDMNHYAKSTPILELKSRDNMDALCRVQIKWKQMRPDIWVSSRGAFTDPFDMLEEKCANMMRDWLLSVSHSEALAEKAKGFTKVEYQWMSELNQTGREYGVAVLGIEITVMRFPHIDSQDERMAVQLAETNLELESQRQKVLKEQEASKLNQATHIRMQEDRDREAEALERLQMVERRKNIAEASTITEKAKMDKEVVQAEMELSLARENKDKAILIAKASSEAEAERIRAEGKRISAQLAAEGEIAATREKNNAQLAFIKEQAALLQNNPGLLELLRIQNDLLKTEAISRCATVNPNVVLLPGIEGLEARRMNKGYAPQVPAAAIVSTDSSRTA